MDRRKLALLEALQIGARERGETRLYRRGKLAGLFAQRTRFNADIASQAVRDGLLEVTRVETVGKTTVEWVRVTQQGLELLLENDSPARALVELRDALAVNLDGMPAWVAQMNERIADLARAHADQVGQIREQLERLADQVNEALARIETDAAPATLPLVPWAQAALNLLEQRQQVGLGTRCPLADLYAALRDSHPALSIKDFHAGLKRLHDSKLIALLPSSSAGDAPNPEYALLDGAAVYYYVGRAG